MEQLTGMSEIEILKQINLGLSDSNSFEDIEYFYIWLTYGHNPNVINIIDSLKFDKFEKHLLSLAGLNTEHNVNDIAFNNQKLEETSRICYSFDNHIWVSFIKSGDFASNIRIYYPRSQRYDTIVNDYVRPMSKFKNTVKSKGSYGLIKTNDFGGGLSIQFLDIKTYPKDLELNYGTDFITVSNDILNFLKSKDSGLVILKGDPGTGKTSYIRYLIHQLHRKKRFLYVPSNMFDGLLNPDLIEFLTNQDDLILVIEDAEKLIASRDIGNYTEALINLLNLTDGLLADSLNFKVIITYNTKREEKIDSALLRNGRLIVNHEFRALPKEDAQKLVDNLKLDYVVDKAMTLAEIYKKDPVSNQTKNKKDKIGFS